jgi:ADP-heptose:LPS heptosyltransferase
LRSTSCERVATRLLGRCIAGKTPGKLPRALLEDACAKALFGTLVEGLADRFDPALCDAYAGLFSQAAAHAIEGMHAASLVARYERVRRTRPVAGEPGRVFVLSRVTLGADIAVTSVLMAAAKDRFPTAEIVFVGPHKNYELFAGDRRIRHAAMEYRRGALRERLSIWDPLKALVAEPGSVVLDPDSRLTQLGLLPVGVEDSYHLFESRGYGAESDRTLPDLAAEWAAETLGVRGAKPYLSLAQRFARPEFKPPAAPYIAVSLGVGENPAKRISGPFEERLLALLGELGLPMWIDRGAGGDEAERVTRAVERSGAPAAFWDGSFAGFAGIIAASRLYVGYDSAGQHAAAACGVPLISIFAGFPVRRMFDRWRPAGPRATVIRVTQPDCDLILDQVRQALAQNG